jgi:mRNA-degrading endonuclease HigB of HigAB toxin-antitoxin module
MRSWRRRLAGKTQNLVFLSEAHGREISLCSFVAFVVKKIFLRYFQNLVFLSEAHGREISLCSFVAFVVKKIFLHYFQNPLSS